MSTKTNHNLNIMLAEHWYPKRRTDADLAERLGVHRTMLYKIKIGDREPTLSMKIQIGNILGIDSRLIFPDDSEK